MRKNKITMSTLRKGEKNKKRMNKKRKNKKKKRKKNLKRCGERGSNTRPSDLQSDALPTELSPLLLFVCIVLLISINFSETYTVQPSCAVSQTEAVCPGPGLNPG